MRGCRGGLDFDRGDVTAALAAADVVYDQRFEIAAETNNPMGLFATVARWEEDRLVVHDSTQWPMMVRRTLATMFGLSEESVRVLAPMSEVGSAPDSARGRTRC